MFVHTVVESYYFPIVVAVEKSDKALSIKSRSKVIGTY